MNQELVGRFERKLEENFKQVRLTDMSSLSVEC